MNRDSRDSKGSRENAEQVAEKKYARGGVDEGQRDVAEGPCEEGSRAAPQVRERGEGRVLSSVNCSVVREVSVPRISEGKMKEESRVLGWGSLDDGLSSLWQRACPPPHYLGQGEYPPQCAPASRRWICHCLI